MIEYRDIPGWPGYRATSEGEVQSAWKRVGPGPRVVSGEWKTRKPGPGTNGYLQLRMRNASGKMQTVHVHVLVALAFKGPRPEGMDVCHDDGDQANNRPGNLIYKTKASNGQDRVRHHTSRKGTAHHNAKLSDDVVAEILSLKDLWLAGYVSSREIAEAHGVGDRHVRKIFGGEKWNHLSRSGESERDAVSSIIAS
jgi:hypothetical protein